MCEAVLPARVQGCPSPSCGGTEGGGCLGVLAVAAKPPSVGPVLDVSQNPLVWREAACLCLGLWPQRRYGSDPPQAEEGQKELPKALAKGATPWWVQPPGQARARLETPSGAARPAPRGLEKSTPGGNSPGGEIGLKNSKSSSQNLGVFRATFGAGSEGPGGPRSPKRDFSRTGVSGVVARKVARIGLSEPRDVI